VGGELNSNDANQAHIQAMIKEGYTALPYQRRTNERAVSWYRGPLVPVVVPAQDDLLPAESAKPLTYLYNDRKIYDTSYGAAWQLGRLLALSTRNFATGLYRWKLSLVQKTVQALAQELDRRKRFEFFENTKATMAGLKGPDPEITGQIAQQIAQQIAAEAPKLQDDLLAWLADLYLLRGVPFWYMVPDEQILPPESIRFFLVDPNWVACLIDGAMSIGRATRSVWDHDQVFAKKWLDQICDKAQSGWRESPRPLSGFLLRSQAVKGWWPGIRAEGRGPNQQELPQLRLELVSASTLLGLFDGEISRVDLYEPLEGIHFGWPPDSESESTSDKVSANGVLSIMKIAGNMQMNIEEAGTSFTAGDFALHMIAQAEKIAFSLGGG